jgi:hypothetical protein
VAGTAFILGLSIGLPLGLSSSKRPLASLTPNGAAVSPDGNVSSTLLPHEFVVSGGDGSEITTEDGSTFVYSNEFGGFCKFLCHGSALEVLLIRSHPPSAGEANNIGFFGGVLALLSPHTTLDFAFLGSNHLIFSSLQGYPILMTHSTTALSPTLGPHL